MVRILHAADLHLDSPFAGLSPEEAAERRALQRKLPEAIVELCIRRDCHLLLLAGDVFDGALVCPETVEALRTAFARCPARIFIAPGNHDPYTARSPWLTTPWPEQVHIFTGAMECVTVEGVCRVWGGGFRSGQAQELLRPIPHGEDGLPEIGIFHGDPLSKGGYHPISAETIRTCGLDYLALGHIHKTFLPQKLGKTHYGWPGVTMGRGFDETGETGVFYTELDGDCRTTFLPMPVPRYEILRLPVEDISVPPHAEGTICRLILTGEAERFDTASLHTMLKDRFAALEIRDETTPPASLWADCGSRTLRGLTMDALKARYDAAETEEARQRALLAARYALAALEGREQP